MWRRKLAPNGLLVHHSRDVATTSTGRERPTRRRDPTPPGTQALQPNPHLIRALQKLNRHAVPQTFFSFSIPPQPLTAPTPKSPATRVLNRSHGNPSANHRESRQRAELPRTPLRRGQVRFPLQRPEALDRRRHHRYPRRRSRRLRCSRRPLPPRVPPPIRLRILPRRHHAPCRLAQAPPPERRGRSLPHRPRRIARQLPRRCAPFRLPRRQTPRPRAAPDRRLRTLLVPRQYRTPPRPPAGRGRRREGLRQVPRYPLRQRSPRRIGFVPASREYRHPRLSIRPAFAQGLAANRRRNRPPSLPRPLSLVERTTGPVRDGTVCQRQGNFSSLAERPRAGAVRRPRGPRS